MVVRRLLVALLCINMIAHAQLFQRGKKELRTTSAGSYQLSVQKNGRVSVLLSSEEAVFENAGPMIWFEGENAPRAIDVAGRESGREDVSDALGKGQGMTLQNDECTWSLRVYPAEPYFAVQAAFTNTRKESVRVKMLSPWTAGDGTRGGMSMGPGTTQCQVLEGGSMFPGDVSVAAIRRGAGDCVWNMAAYNGQNGRSIVAGFLTYTSGYGRLRMVQPESGGDDRWFGLFAAECVYDPPVTLEPGQQLVSEPLYIAVAEENVFQGLERYGRAYGAANGINRESLKFLPHGWDSWNTEYGSDINEAKIREDIEFVAANLTPYGWNHFAIDDGWQVALGDWEAHPERFPSGMKAVADLIHSKGMTAGLWIAPFKVSLDSALAKAHPEWLREPTEFGRQVVGEKDRILDVTAPGAYEWVRDLAKKVTQDWGFDAVVEADYVYYLPLAVSYADGKSTRVEAHRKGMQALRDGMGPDRFLMSFAPQPITALYAEGIRFGNDCAPIWSKSPEHWAWGCVETLTNAARRYYYAPWVFRGDQDCAYFAQDATRQRWNATTQPPLTMEQSIAWLTGAVLTGGAVKIGDRFTALTPEQLDVLRKLLPVMDRPARPVDLFREQHPRIWVLPVKTAMSESTVVGVFNWSEVEHVVPLDFRELGLATSTFYTVYGYWEDKYYGSAEGQVQVLVPPRSVRLLSFRQYQARPMFLATSRHFAGEAADHTALHWHDVEKRMDGSFTGIAGATYKLRVLVPEGYGDAVVTVSCGPATTAMEGRLLKIEFACPQAGQVDWSVAFP